MGFVIKIAFRLVLNGIALWAAGSFFDGFILTGGLESLIVGAVVLTLLNTFIRPVLKFFTLPLVWITFGLFNIVINMFLLWTADQLITSLAITDIWTLFWVSIIVAIANAFI